MTTTTPIPEIIIRSTRGPDLNRVDIYITPSSKNNNELNLFIKPYKLVNVSIASPEEYDVFKNDCLVGCFKLTFQEFTAKSTHDNVIIYKKIIDDQPEEIGVFTDDDQRMKELETAVNFLHEYLIRTNFIADC